MSRSVFPSRDMLLVAGLLVTSFATGIAAGELTRPTDDMKNEARALMVLCHDDYVRLCSKVLPGGGRILTCLKENGAALSEDCAAALPRADALKADAEAAGVMPK